MTDVLHRADQCKRLLDDPFLKQAFQDVRDAIHQKFERTSVTDRDTLVELRQMLHLLDSVKANLEQAVMDGQLDVLRGEERERGGFLGDIWKRAAKTG